MKIIKIIESRVWQDVDTGAECSIYGVRPPGNWRLVTRGFTWQLDNGTVGLGRVPAKTLKEAELIMKTFNERID